MSFIENMKEEAKKEIKTIVLPESEDLRTLKATQIVLEEGFANIVLIGDADDIKKQAEENNIDLTGAQIVNPATSNNFSRYANDLYELRKNKGMTLKQAKELLMQNSRYRWIRIWRITPNFRYIKTSSSNIKGCSGNKACISFLRNGITR